MLENLQIRTFPDPQVVINTVKDLDSFFDSKVGAQVVVKGTELSNQMKTHTINIKDVYCYVSLDFVQFYHLKHLMYEVNASTYNYAFAATDFPDVYKVTASYNRLR